MVRSAADDTPSRGGTADRAAGSAGRAAQPRSDRCGCDGSCPNGPAAPSARGASPTTWVRSRTSEERVGHRTPSAHRSPDRDLARLGELLHLDSLGSEQTDPSWPAQPDDGRRRRGARRGGHGRIAGSYRECSCGWPSPSRPATGRQPSNTMPSCRSSSSAGVGAIVLVGDFAGARPPARRDTDHLGVELGLRAPGDDAPLRAGLRVCLGRPGRGGRRRGPGGRARHAGLSRVGAGRVPARGLRPARALLLGASLSPSPSSCGGTSWAAAGDESPRRGGSGRTEDKRFGTVRSRSGGSRSAAAVGVTIGPRRYHSPQPEGLTDPVMVRGSTGPACSAAW